METKPATKSHPPYLPLYVAQRLLALAFLAVAFWYLTWRTGTFNPSARYFSWAVYAAECYGFLSVLMHLFMVWRLSVREPPPAPEGKTVDVFVTTYDERVDLVRRTMVGAMAIDYPHTTWLLDDGNRPEMKALAQEVGCRYLARTENTDAKAGNLNNALEHSNGEFVAIFDADHVPNARFLSRTLGYFQDEKLAFVQCPQEFYNLDSYQTRHRGRLRWGEQAFFFRVIQRGKDYWNATMFAGTTAVLRRAALDSVGGFARGTVAEDFHTTLKLQKKGWNSVYHAEALAFGLAAPSLRTFLRQRLRWGQGAMQIWRAEGLFFTRGYSLAQRICNGASILTYFDSWQRLFLYVVPGVVLITGVMPIYTFNVAFLLHFLPFYFLSFWLFEELTRGYGNTPNIEQYNLLRGFVFAYATLAVVRGRIRFHVSSKSHDTRGSEALLLLPQLLLFVYLGLSIVIGAWLYQRHLVTLPQDAFIANVLWAGLTGLIAIAAIGFTFTRRARRSEYRFPVPLAVQVECDDEPVLGVADDISSRGLRLYAECVPERKPGDTLTGTLLLPEGGMRFVANVVDVPRGERRHYGLRFVWKEADSPVQLLRFLYGSQLQWRVRGLIQRIRTPLESLTDTILQRPQRQVPNPKYWAPLLGTTENGGKPELVGLISGGERRGENPLVLSLQPLPPDRTLSLLRLGKYHRELVQGKLRALQRHDTPSVEPYLYEVEK